jgi:hypothetical protein
MKANGRLIRQIAVAEAIEPNEFTRTIIAVCEDGTAWILNQAQSRWSPLPCIPGVSAEKAA